MRGLRAVVILSFLSAFILAVTAHMHDHSHGHGHGHNGPKPCNDNPDTHSHLPLCSSITDSKSSEEDSSREVVAKPIGDSDASTDGFTALERAHWCRMGNGTFVPLNHSFSHTPCTLCRCTIHRSFQCRLLECMPTYCLNNTRPVRPESECCTRCPADPPTASCVHDGDTYLHGVVIKAIPGKMQCWCHFGHIECREYTGTLYSSLSLLADGVFLYAIMIVLFVVLFFGFIMCCGCSAFILYYYQQNQQSFQDVYNQC